MTLVVFVGLSLSLLAAIAGALLSKQPTKNKAKADSQKRFKNIPKYLPKLSTYGMIINFLADGRFIYPNPPSKPAN
jgi:hypothetical protein